LGRPETDARLRAINAFGQVFDFNTCEEAKWLGDLMQNASSFSPVVPAKAPASGDPVSQDRGYCVPAFAGTTGLVGLRQSFASLALPVLYGDVFGFRSASKKMRSAQRHGPVVVAMAVVRVMQPSVHEIIDVIAMRYAFVSAARTVRMRAPCRGRAARRVGVADFDQVFVDMISMHVMQVAVVQIIDMAFMAHSRVPAVRTMLMCVIGMMRLGAGGHGSPHLFWRLVRSSFAVRLAA
jgi:hypothetical protein